MQKDISVYATHGPLNNSYFADEASHTRHTQSPNEKKKKIATFLLRRSCPVGTRGSRALHHESPAHEAKETAPPSTKQKASLFAPVKGTLLTKPRSLFFFSHSSFPLQQLSLNPLRTRCSLLSTLTTTSVRTVSSRSSASTHALLSSEAPPPSLVPRPFWACLRSLCQSGERTRPPLVNVTGGRSHRCAGRLSA